MLAAVSIVASVRSQAPSGGAKTVTIVMAGPAFASGTAQDALLMSVSWVDFADQLFPRQNVRVRMDYWWNPQKTTTVLADARERRFDYDRAKFLFSKAPYFERGTVLTLMCDLNHPDVKRATHWLRDQLIRLGINTGKDIRPDPGKLESVKSEAILVVRTR